MLVLLVDLLVLTCTGKYLLILLTLVNQRVLLVLEVTLDLWDMIGKHRSLVSQAVSLLYHSFRRTTTRRRATLRRWHPMSLTSMMRSSSSGFRSLAERTQLCRLICNHRVWAGIAGALASALAPLGNLRQSLMEAVSAGNPAVASAGSGSDNSSVAADGDVSMFPTSSPVRDGGHVFAGDV